MAGEARLQTRIEQIKRAPSVAKITNIMGAQHRNLARIPKTMAGNLLAISVAKETKYAALQSSKGKVSEKLVETIGNLDRLVFCRTFNYEAVQNTVELLKAARKASGKERNRLIRKAIAELDRHPLEKFYMHESLDLAGKVIREIQKGIDGKNAGEMVQHLNALIKIRAPAVYKISP